MNVVIGLPNHHRVKFPDVLGEIMISLHKFGSNARLYFGLKRNFCVKFEMVFACMKCAAKMMYVCDTKLETDFEQVWRYL